MALLSKRLVTIQLDVPHEIDLDSLERRPHDDEKLKALLMELEFDTLGKKLFGKSFSSATSRAKVIREKRETEIQATLFDEPVNEKTIKDVKHDYHTVQTADERAALIGKLKQAVEHSVSTPKPRDSIRARALPLGIAFCFEPHRHTTSFARTIPKRRWR